MSKYQVQYPPPTGARNEFIADSMACAAQMVPVRVLDCGTGISQARATPPNVLLAKFSTSMSDRRPYSHTVHLFISNTWLLAQKLLAKGNFPVRLSRYKSIGF